MRQDGPIKPLRTACGLWVVLFVIWTAASSSLAPAELIFGAVMTGGIALASSRGPTVWSGLRFSPRAVVALMRYTVIFLREMVASNLNMLRIVFAPQVDVRPSIVPTRARLTSPMGRFVLSNTVSLTPGTLVMGLEDDTLSVHVLDLKTTDIDANTTAVSGAFQPDLARTFG